MARWMLTILVLAVTACQTPPPTEPPPEAPAEAQQAQSPSIPIVCPDATRRELLAFLQAEHGEEASAGGLVSNGKVWVEITEAPDGTWTLLATVIPNGPTCVVFEGVEWRHILPGRPA